MSYWFPDTTVLRNFACLRRLDLLTLVLNGRGRCCEAMHHEIDDASHVSGFDSLRDYIDESILGTPVVIDDPADILVVQGIRVDEMGGSRRDPRSSLGEAETLFVLRHRDDFKQSHWVTDDVAAYDYGRRNGLITLATVDVMAIAVSRGAITGDEGFRLLTLMGSRGRVLAFTPTSVGDLSRRVSTWEKQLTHFQ